jgi:AAA domain
LLDGDPGLGKTMIAGDLAARFTTGAAMPDDSPGIEGGASVVIFTAEDGAGDTLQPRIKAAGGNLSRVLVVTTIPVHGSQSGDVVGERFPTFLDLDVIERAIGRVSARLVIFDPFMSYLPPTVNSFRDQEVRTALAPVARLAAKTGAIFFLIRHLNKSQSANPLYRGGGTIGIIGAARSALLVARDPNDETKCVLASTKNNLAALPPSLSYSIGATADGVPVITWHGESDHTARALLAEPENADDRSATDDALDWLSGELADGPAKAEDIERKARGRFSEKALRRARKRLGIKPKKRGFGDTGYWEWSLPPPTPPEPPKAPSQDKGAPLTGQGILGTEGHLSNGHEPAGTCAVCGNLLDYADATRTAYLPCAWCAEAAAAKG